MMQHLQTPLYNNLHFRDSGKNYDCSFASLQVLLIWFLSNNAQIVGNTARVAVSPAFSSLAFCETSNTVV